MRALESPAVERAIIRVLESDAAQDALERTLSSPRSSAPRSRCSTPTLVDHVWDRLLASDEAQKLVERIAEAPEVRAAITSQGVGLIDDLGRQVREIADRARRRRSSASSRGCCGAPQRRATETPTSGSSPARSRSLIDGAIINGIFLGSPRRCTTALFGERRRLRRGLAFGAGAWICRRLALPADVLVARRPDARDARSLSIRIEAGGERSASAARRARRLVGTVLAALPLGLGFLGIVTRDDRRGFHDRRAGTDVVRVDRMAPGPRRSRDRG